MQNYLLIFCIEVLLIPHFSIDNIPNPSGLKYDFIYFNFEKKKKNLSTKTTIKSITSKILRAIYVFKKELSIFYIIKNWYITYLNIITIIFIVNFFLYYLLSSNSIWFFLFVCEILI